MRALSAGNPAAFKSPNLTPNPGKELLCRFKDEVWIRIPIKTRTLYPNDNLYTFINEYCLDLVLDEDTVFVTEKIVAISQGRAFPLEEIRPSFLARFLSKFVTKTPHGIGLGIPQTMQMALKECGTPRILFAAFCSFITKLFGVRGTFYKIAGTQARAIDGPTQGTLPPYDRYIVLAPQDADSVARDIAKELCKNNKNIKNITVIIVDINDLGGNILGIYSEESTSKAEKRKEKNVLFSKYLHILKDNPLGQGNQSTPIGILRQINPLK